MKPKYKYGDKVVDLVSRIVFEPCNENIDVLNQRPNIATGYELFEIWNSPVYKLLLESEE